MKTLTRRKILIVAALVVGLGIFPDDADASVILWTSNATSPSAWITTTNWEGGVMPVAGDVAQFNNLGSLEILYSMTHASNPTPNEANIGAVQLLSTRVTRDLMIESNSSSANTFYYHGSTINSIDRTVLANDSAKNLTITKTTGVGVAKVAFNTSADSVIQVNGTGDISILLPIAGTASRLIVQGTGSGRLILGGANSTYSGGTLLSSPAILSIAANGAAGTGAITNSGGTLQIEAALNLTNNIILASETAVYNRSFNLSDAYNVYTADSGFGANTSASMLAGTAGDVRTVTGSFADVAVASNDLSRVSKVFNLAGTATDIFVLQLSIDGPLDPDSYLGWLSGGAWINAADGNSSTGALAMFGVASSFVGSGANATADYLGTWGYDTAGRSVWAVLDHNSSFAVIPEPMTLKLLGGALLFFILFLQRRRANSNN
jgi:autotransporter-associated beta strand protein